MSEATGTLIVRELGTVKTYAWNGNLDDRERAREAFESFMSTGASLAVAFDSPTAKTATRVTSFSEVETIERERGTVVVQVSRGLVGG